MKRIGSVPGFGRGVPGAAKPFASPKPTSNNGPRGVRSFAMRAVAKVPGVALVKQHTSKTNHDAMLGQTIKEIGC